MAKLAFLADVHVKRSYVSAVRSSGYQMLWLDNKQYEPMVTDERLLAKGRQEGLVIITNDTDFVDLGRTAAHAGIIMYQQVEHSPGTFVRALTRMDRYLTPEVFRNHVEWLENWV